MLKAITDVRGVPLAASQENVQKLRAGARRNFELGFGYAGANGANLSSQAANTFAAAERSYYGRANTGKIKAMPGILRTTRLRADIKIRAVLQNAAVTKCY